MSTDLDFFNLILWSSTYRSKSNDFWM